MNKKISLQENANKAFTIHQEIIQLKNVVGGAFIVMGQRLKEIKEKIYVKMESSKSGI